MLGTQYPSVSQSPSQNPAHFTNIVQVQTTPPGMTGQPTSAGAAAQTFTAPSGQSSTPRLNMGQAVRPQGPQTPSNTPRFNVGQAVQSPRTQTPRGRGRGRGRGKGKKQRGNSVHNSGYVPEQQVNMINQQEQPFQQYTPTVQASEAKQMFQDSVQSKSTLGQGQNRPNLGQGQNRQNVRQEQKGQVQPVRLIRSDSQGKAIATYSAMPTKTEEGRTVYKLKIENVQKRIVQASPSTPTKRTVVAGSGQGQIARKIVTNSITNEPEPSRTVVATGRVSDHELIYRIIDSVSHTS